MVREGRGFAREQDFQFSDEPAPDGAIRIVVNARPSI